MPCRLATPTPRAAALLLAALTAWPAFGADAPPPEQEQVVVPKVERRDVRLPRFASRDFELGVFVGSYSVQNFGTHPVGGVRLGYHITEDFFVEGTLAQTKVSDELFRQIQPAGIFPQPSQKLSYYNLSVGYNVMPGEVFFGRNSAKASQFYVIGGVGATRIAEQRQQTFNLGAGLRLYLSNQFSVQLDMRDHIFPLDLLQQRKSTQNLEFSAGAAFYF